jgi:hypothetical protein
LRARREELDPADRLHRDRKGAAQAEDTGGGKGAEETYNRQGWIIEGEPRSGRAR